MLNSNHWEAVAGLVIRLAQFASPIAAKISNRISAKAIMIAVNGVIVIPVNA